MTISFFSNFLNSHQLPLCKAIIEKVGAENFRFIATTRISEDRLAFGFEDMNETHPFVVKAYESKELLEEAHRLAKESDIVIIGSAPYCFSDDRRDSDKLTFNFSERLFKKGKWMLLYPPKARRCYHQYTKNRNKSYYVLCASAYTKEDLMYCLFPSNKCFRWGYFTDIRCQNIEKLFINKDNYKKETHTEVSILWAGRLISWKHPELAIRLAKQLSNQNINFRMDIIGSGVLEQKIKESVINNNLEDKVFVLGPKTSQEVRQFMENSDIYLFTSDKNEGWGAVLNEAMNSGCAVVANQEIGSVPYLVKDMVNGLIFKNGDVDSLFEKVKWLIDHPEKRKNIGIKAYETMINQWNASVAVDRFFMLIDSIKNNKPNPIKTGPCSQA